uniref:Uncharacterized protein n=1 Tax=Anguilla anguilla TaxID=7936 RepID=A0A0E9R5Y6_ANGAN
MIYNKRICPATEHSTLPQLHKSACGFLSSFFLVRMAERLHSYYAREWKSYCFISPF